MPEITHSCGAKLKFPSAMEGKKGKCPTCGQVVMLPSPSSGEIAALVAEATPQPQAGLVVPESSPELPTISPTTRPAPTPVPPPKRAGLAPVAKPRLPTPDEKNELDPPPHWEEYQAYIDGKGPAPRVTIIPFQIMLKEDAEKKWETAAQKPPPSKFFCPGCKTRLDVGGLICVKCGLDLRTGRSVDGKSKLTPSGMEYLAKITWLNEVGKDEESSGKKLSKKPKREPS